MKSRVAKVFVQQKHVLTRDERGAPTAYNVGLQAAEDGDLLKKGAMFMLPLSDITGLDDSKVYEIEIRLAK